MEKNGFKIAGDLNNDGMSYFQRGGSLEEPVKAGESSFKPAGDLNNDGMSYFQRGGSLEEPVKAGESPFKPAGDLSNNGMSYFQRGGSLEEPVKAGESSFNPAGDLSNNGMSYFQRGGSLEEPVKAGESSFKPAGDLKSINTNTAFKFEEKNYVLKTSDDIRKWLKTIVSGKKMSDEGLMATGGGQMFVTVDKLDEMIKNGDNIIKAEYFENMNMILIEFESFGLNNNMKCR